MSIDIDGIVESVRSAKFTSELKGVGNSVGEVVDEVQKIFPIGSLFYSHSQYLTASRSELVLDFSMRIHDKLKMFSYTTDIDLEIWDIRPSLFRQIANNLISMLEKEDSHKGTITFSISGDATVTAEYKNKLMNLIARESISMGVTALFKWEEPTPEVVPKDLTKEKRNE